MRLETDEHAEAHRQGSQWAGVACPSFMQRSVGTCITEPWSPRALEPWPSRQHWNSPRSAGRGSRNRAFCAQSTYGFGRLLRAAGSVQETERPRDVQRTVWLYYCIPYCLLHLLSGTRELTLSPSRSTHD